jgi:hypothetical protein
MLREQLSNTRISRATEGAAGQIKRLFALAAPNPDGKHPFEFQIGDETHQPTQPIEVADIPKAARKFQCVGVDGVIEEEITGGGSDAELQTMIDNGVDGKVWPEDHEL